MGFRVHGFRVLGSRVLVFSFKGLFCRMRSGSMG